MCRSIISLRKCVLRWSIFFTKPYPTNIQTYRSGLIHFLTQVQVFRGNVFPCCWYSLWIPTRAQYKQEDCIDWVMCKNITSKRKCTLRWSIFFTNLYPANIQTNRSGLIQFLMQKHVFRENVHPGGRFSTWIPTRARSRRIDQFSSHYVQNC